MKLHNYFSLVFVALVFASCSKSSDTTVQHVNCDGLVTDTLPTGNTGRIYMPNAFSPNADGLNDIARPVTQNITAIAFTIYDENNVVVFTTNVLGQGWQPAPGAVSAIKYYYKIQTTTTAGKHIGSCGDLYKLTCFPLNPTRSFFYFEDMLTPSGFTGVTAEAMANCP